jgi:hypothetical protein
VIDQARQIGISWERMADPRPRLTLEIFTPSGHEQIFYLGPHAPRLTPKEIDLLHKLWLEATDRLPDEEMHHHDIVHFALTEFQRIIGEGQGDDAIQRLREHLEEIKCRRHPAPDVDSPIEASTPTSAADSPEPLDLNIDPHRPQ